MVEVEALGEAEVRCHPAVAPNPRGSETRLAEDAVQTLRLGLSLHRSRARYDHRADVGVNLVPFEQLGGLAQIAEPAVGARSDEDAVDL